MQLDFRIDNVMPVNRYLPVRGRANVCCAHSCTLVKCHVAAQKCDVYPVFFRLAVRSCSIYSLSKSLAKSVRAAGAMVFHKILYSSNRQPAFVNIHMYEN